MFLRLLSMLLALVLADPRPAAAPHALAAAGPTALPPVARATRVVSAALAAPLSISPPPAVARAAAAITLPPARDLFATLAALEPVAALAAVAEPRAAIANLISPAPPTCIARGRQGLHQLRVRDCPAGVLDVVDRYAPDLLVVLGGGVIRADQAGCATDQRAWTAARVFDRLAEPPTLVLTGRGPRHVPGPLTPAQRRCAIALRERPLPAGLDPRESARELATLRGGGSVALTEAEHMCATLLASRPRSTWEATLAHVVFEPEAQSTGGNVWRSLPLIEQAGAQRVLVVSAPVFLGQGRVDNHAARAAQAFRRARRATAAFHVGGVGCSFTETGPHWVGLEP